MDRTSKKEPTHAPIPGKPKPGAKPVNELSEKDLGKVNGGIRSPIPVSHGDEAGTMKGTRSSKVGG